MCSSDLRGPRSMAWLVARRELPPSLFSFLHGRTRSAPCFITFLTLWFLLLQDGRFPPCRFKRVRSTWEIRSLTSLLASRGSLARHSSSRSVRYLLARSICPLEVASGTCLERRIASRGILLKLFSLQALEMKKYVPWRTGLQKVDN